MDYPNVIYISPIKTSHRLHSTEIATGKIQLYLNQVAKKKSSLNSDNMEMYIPLMW